jgi:hypothetical protein
MTTISDLIVNGLIEVGDTLIWTRRSLGEIHTAVVQANGTLVTEDGVTHKTPSGAAKHFSQKPIDGWNTWKVGESKQSIGSLRSKLQQ